MPEGGFIERPSGVEQKKPQEIPLTVERTDGVTTFVLKTADQRTRAAVSHVLSDRFGMDRLHPYFKGETSRYTIDDGTPSVDDEILESILEETQTVLKRMPKDMSFEEPESPEIKKAA